MRLLLALALLAAAPLALADAYAHEDEILATGAAVLTTEGHDFVFTARVGDVIEARLAWEQSPARDLDLFLTVPAPAPACGIFPAPDASCLTQVLGVQGACGSRGLLTSEESFVLTAPADGVYRLAVASNLPGRTAYALTLSVDAAAPEVDGPVPTRHVQRDVACKLA